MCACYRRPLPSFLPSPAGRAYRLWDPNPCPPPLAPVPPSAASRGWRELERGRASPEGLRGRRVCSAGRFGIRGKGRRGDGSKCPGDREGRRRPAGTQATGKGLPVGAARGFPAACQAARGGGERRRAFPECICRVAGCATAAGSGGSLTVRLARALFAAAAPGGSRRGEAAPMAVAEVGSLASLGSEERRLPGSPVPSEREGSGSVLCWASFRSALLLRRLGPPAGVCTLDSPAAP